MGNRDGRASQPRTRPPRRHCPARRALEGPKDAGAQGHLASRVALDRTALSTLTIFSSIRGYLSHGQVAALAAAVDRQAEVVRFLAYTGLRWGEMAALRVQDFDMLRRRVNVSRSVTESGGLVWSTPKTWERRSVPFPAALAGELAALMIGKRRDDLVFTDMRGGVLRNSNWRARVFDAAVGKCQRADDAFPSITPDDLRHTAASLAISAGANVKAVQRMLGHAKASVTLDVYADLFDEDLDDVAANLDAAIRSTAYPLRTGQPQGHT